MIVIAQRIRLDLSSCCPGFESQANQLSFLQIIHKFNVKSTKIKQKEAGIGSFFKKLNGIKMYCWVNNVFQWHFHSFRFKLENAFFALEDLF